MAGERIVTTGVVKGNTIVLEGNVPFPDSARVLVTVAVEEDSLEERERAFYARLEAEGVITIPQTPPERIRRNKPIAVKGKPLSQVIIEERR